MVIYVIYSSIILPWAFTRKVAVEVEIVGFVFFFLPFLVGTKFYSLTLHSFLSISIAVAEGRRH